VEVAYNGIVKKDEHPSTSVPQWVGVILDEQRERQWNRIKHMNSIV
jgi:hypothetical protein